MSGRRRHGVSVSLVPVVSVPCRAVPGCISVPERPWRAADASRGTATGRLSSSGRRFDAIGRGAPRRVRSMIDATKAAVVQIKTKHTTALWRHKSEGHTQRSSACVERRAVYDHGCDCSPSRNHSVSWGKMRRRWFHGIWYRCQIRDQTRFHPQFTFDTSWSPSPCDERAGNVFHHLTHAATIISFRSRARRQQSNQLVLHVPHSRELDIFQLNPLWCNGNYSTTSNNMRLVHRPLTDQM